MFEKTKSVAVIAALVFLPTNSANASTQSSKQQSQLSIVKSNIFRNEFEATADYHEDLTSLGLDKKNEGLASKKNGKKPLSTGQKLKSMSKIRFILF